jgi:hypothetical protein
VLVLLGFADAKTCTEPDTTVRLLSLRAVTAELAMGGWVSTKSIALTTAATRDIDLGLLIISLSFHQFHSTEKTRY